MRLKQHKANENSVRNLLLTFHNRIFATAVKSHMLHHFIEQAFGPVPQIMNLIVARAGEPVIHRLIS